MGSFTRIAALALVTALFAACSTTVNETDANGDPTQLLSEAELTGGEGREIAEDDTSPLDPEVIVDSDAPETTIPIAGTAADLLPDIGIDMSQLSAQIGDVGDEDATIARIEASWAAIKAEVTSTHPQLVNSIQATVDMARTGVDANRPADADKAFSLLTDLIDAFTGDS
ncbi:MAG: hypothetical protein ACJAR2_002931 [Ilumatobacter sp.]|jgi:hypothetical protein